MYDLRLTNSCCPAQKDDALIERTVGDALRLAAATWPAEEALVEADGDGILRRRWTYAGLLADAERLAGALLTRYRPGERVAVWAPNLPEWVLLEYATALAGLTLVTANPAYQKRELAYVLNQSGAAGLFMIAEHRGNPMARVAAEAAAEAEAVRELVDMEDQAALFQLAGEPPPLPRVAPRDPVQIQYTSGTTGFPKGAVLHHSGLTNNARHGYHRIGIDPGDPVLMFMPLFHTAGCALGVLGSCQVGARMILARVFDPQAMNAIIEAEDVVAMLGVPTMLIAMLEADRARPRRFRGLRVVASGGSMVPPELVRSFAARFGCAFCTLYGQTETSPLLTHTFLDDPFDLICETIGQPMPHTELSIRDPASDTVQPVGTIGEICARAYSVMLGYNDNPDATAAAFGVDGWLRTGDLGTMDARGYVRITGRVKDMIIRAGENLFPAEIENVLLEHPSVAECAVVGVPDPRLGEAVAAFIRPAAGAAMDAAALAAHCRTAISPQKTPAHWIQVSEWPLTGSGKIQKYVLRERFLAEHAAPEEPRSRARFRSDGGSSTNTRQATTSMKPGAVIRGKNAMQGHRATPAPTGAAPHG